MTADVLITSVVQKPSGWIVVTDSTGVEHATKDLFLGSVADRYRVSGCRVDVDSGSGWHWRELRGVTRVGAK